MRRTAIAAVLACAMLLAVSIVSPAFGGPSIGSIAKTAKKALKTGKSANRTATAANRTANGAKSTANAAHSLAGSANGKADQALARPVVTPGGITLAKSAVSSVPPGSVGSAIAFCPAGHRAISGGGFFNTGAGDGILASRANDDRTSWFVLGLSTSSITGTIEAYAYCTPAGTAVTAGNTRARTRAEVARLVSDARNLAQRAGAVPPTANAAHSCSSGYKHAVTPGGHKCLRAGQYCSTKPGYASVYKSKGYVCKGGRLKNR
jgi:hypothetical protein